MTFPEFLRPSIIRSCIHVLYLFNVNVEVRMKNGNPGLQCDQPRFQRSAMLSSRARERSPAFFYRSASVSIGAMRR